MARAIAVVGGPRVDTRVVTGSVGASRIMVVRPAPGHRIPAPAGVRKYGHQSQGGKAQGALHVAEVEVVEVIKVGARQQVVKSAPVVVVAAVQSFDGQGVASYRERFDALPGETTTWQSRCRAAPA